jgi:hypothetical protein
MTPESELAEAIADSAEATIALADAYRAMAVSPLREQPAPIINVPAPVIHMSPAQERPRKYRISITSRDSQGRWKTAEIEAQ